MPQSGAKTRHLQYPPLPFYLIRFCCLLSATVVVAIVFYLTYHLRHGNVKIPWAFIVVTICALLSLTNLFITTLIRGCRPFPILLSLVFNLVLVILWIICLGVLSWHLSHTLTTKCSTTIGDPSNGIRVCHLYKTLFSFTVLSFSAHSAALILDIRTWSSARNYSEKYDIMPDNSSYTHSRSASGSSQQFSLLSTADTVDPNLPQTPHSPHDIALETYWVHQRHGEGDQYRSELHDSYEQSGMAKPTRKSGSGSVSDPGSRSVSLRFDSSTVPVRDFATFSEQMRYFSMQG